MCRTDNDGLWYWASNLNSESSLFINTYFWSNTSLHHNNILASRFLSLMNPLDRQQRIISNVNVGSYLLLMSLSCNSQKSSEIQSQRWKTTGHEFNLLIDNTVILYTSKKKRKQQTAIWMICFSLKTLSFWVNFFVYEDRLIKKATRYNCRKAWKEMNSPQTISPTQCETTELRWFTC